MLVSMGAALPVIAQQRAGTSSGEPSLRAVQLLERRSPGTPARVRFEWNQMPGAHEYVLIGRSMQPPSWTIQSREHRVTRRNARSWSESLVTFDVTLAPGSYSWRVVALLGAKSKPDSANGPPLGFDVR